ncbi:ABC transporter substrate-binding protein [Streptomyces sp. NPDC006422]|uniref:ABC transporter substrate-binding protein n=1 Tax=unclassified Streptomyces TaxID=2593676 RepID=UPI0033AB084E
MPVLFARQLRRCAPLLAGALFLSGCGASGAAEDDRAGGGGGHGVTLKNCGDTVRVEHAPKRAVALDQGAAEIMLSLGLEDRMVGTATWTDPVLKGLEKANAKVPRLADRYPSFEKVLGTEPDFAAASFTYTLGKGGVAPRSEFEKLGVPTYLSPTDCVGKDNGGDGDGVRTTSLTLDTMYGEIRDIAQVFGVEGRGEELVRQLKSRVSKATTGVDARGVDVLYWFANSDSPYMAGCCGAPGVVTKELGARNVFDDTRAEWPQVNWETVAERDPDVLVIGDLTRRSQSAESAAQKIRFLESNPVTRNMTAVKKKRYVKLSGQAMNPTIRTVDGVEQVAKGLRSFGLAR